MEDKNKGFTPMQNKFMEALFDDSTFGDTHAAKLVAGYSPDTDVSQIMKPLKDEIVERTRQYIAANSPKAAKAMVDAVDNPNELGTNIRIQAAEKLLDRAGVIKEEKVDAVSPSNIMFILPPKDEN